MTTATTANPATARRQFAPFVPGHNGTRYRLAFGIPCRKCGSTPLRLEFHDRLLFATSCPTCGDGIYYRRDTGAGSQPPTGPPAGAG